MISLASRSFVVGPCALQNKQGDAMSFFRDVPPNVDEPLSEPVVCRRIHSAYLRAGHTSKTFAAAINIHPEFLGSCDRGIAGPIALAKLLRAADLLGYSAKQLIFGSDVGTAKELHPELSPTAVRALLGEIDASLDERRVWAAYMSQLPYHAGRNTRVFITSFIWSYGACLHAGMRVEQANGVATRGATNAAAQAGCIAEGMVPLDRERSRVAARRRERNQPTVIAIERARRRS